METGRYNYIRTVQTPGSADERTRSRIVGEVWHCLAGQPVDAECHRMVPMILGVLGRPPRLDNWRLWSWIYSYGDNGLVRRLTDQGRHPLVPDIAALPAVPDPLAHLLPLEHTMPDLQRYVRADRPRRTLICFTGNDLQLNVPVQLFHLFAIRLFEQVIYLRDWQRQFFTRGLQGISDTFEGLCDALRDMIGSSETVSVMSTSSGGYPAIRCAEHLDANRVVLFSPPMTFKQVPAVIGRGSLDERNVRLIYATRNAMDARFAAEWAGTRYAAGIEWIDLDTHATMWACIRDDRLQPILRWLGRVDDETARTDSEPQATPSGGTVCP